ncbi:MAG: hypothetical protein KA974_01490 [Saprospiraceae bacterium]|nr:hypothetical protein [Saprospiraceae bacterium]MBP7699418.1 hypothetical protein [Saprospiraceae bacterium]
MKPHRINANFWLISGLIILTVGSRVIPHAYNFTPIGAVALFGAAYFKDKRWSFFLPLLIMWLSDLYLNNYVYTAYKSSPEFEWWGMTSVYIALLLSVVLGVVVFRSKVSIIRVGLASVSASVLFFLITNCTSWYGNPMYTQDFAGLMTSYAAGLPFFYKTLIGDLVYSAILFGVYNWVVSSVPKLQHEQSR